MTKKIQVEDCCGCPIAEAEGGALLCPLMDRKEVDPFTLDVECPLEDDDR